MSGLCIASAAQSISLDLKRMNNILDIDEKNMTATIEPYVSFARLQAETMKRGLWNGGTPLAPASNSLLSNIMFLGLWQSALKYGAGTRSLVDLEVVLANGDILTTGSSTIDGVCSFLWHGPGPDIMGLFELTHFGALGVITKATIKLYPWVGGEWPQEDVYDRPHLPQRHRIYYIEYPGFDSMQEALYEIAHSGIGTHLNAMADAYNCCYTQPTQRLTEKKYKDGLFPKHLVYVVIAGISSMRQLEYEEKVLLAIINDTGGRLRDDLKEELSTWHADAFRSGDTVRMCRPGGFALQRIGTAHIDTSELYNDIHQRIVNKYPHHWLDEETPFEYVYDRGYFCFHETDTYFDQSNIEEVKASREQAKEAFIDNYCTDGLGWSLFMEPMTSILGPTVGPNFHIYLQKIKLIFDPNDTMNPGRLINMHDKG